MSCNQTHLLIVFEDIFKDEAIKLLPLICVWTCSYPYLQRNPQRETWAPVSLSNIFEYEIIKNFFAEFTVINCTVKALFNLHADAHV